MLVAGAYLSQGVFAYICVAYLISYRTTVAKIPRTDPLLGIFVAAVVAVMAYPLFGALSDRVGRKPVFVGGAVAMGPLVLIFGLAMAPAAGVTGSLFSLMFDADVRYSAVSVPVANPGPYHSHIWESCAEIANWAGINPLGRRNLL